MGEAFAEVGDVGTDGGEGVSASPLLRKGAVEEGGDVGEVVFLEAAGG